YNLGYPVNTQYDDFAAISDNAMRSGYFTSNRTTGAGGDDIYSFEVLKPLPMGKRLLGRVNDSTHTGIASALVSLRDENSNLADTTTSDAAGNFVFLAEANKNFSLTAQKAGYVDGTTTANTMTDKVNVNVEIILKPVYVPTAKDLELEAATGLNPIYFDVDKFNIRKDAKPGLNKVVTFLEQNPNTAIELSAYTDCRESEQYNQVLSDKRANAVVTYLRKRSSKPGRINGKGYGESHLVNSCACEGKKRSVCDESSHQANRRTEFKIVD
ncbi:MAG: OmpA family protein, partial [Bacteroidota bacterium]